MRILDETINMIKRHGRMVFIIVLLIVSIAVTKYQLKLLSRPTPIKIGDLPGEFLSVGLSATGEYSVLTFYDYSKSIQDARRSMDINEIKIKRDTLWPDSHVVFGDELGGYHFYIPKNDLRKATEQINKTMEHNMQGFTIKILNDDPDRKNQTIYLDKWDDDFNYYFVYEVRGDSLLPLRYGDLTKQDGGIAIVAGCKTFAVGLALLCGFLVVKWVRFAGHGKNE